MRTKNGMSKATDVQISYLDVCVQKTLEEVIINNCRWTADASRRYTDVFVPSIQIFSTKDIQNFVTEMEK